MLLAPSDDKRFQKTHALKAMGYYTLCGRIDYNIAKSDWISDDLFVIEMILKELLMDEEEWVVIDELAGDAQAEILGGLLAAQGIKAYISQEGAGHSALALTVGLLGKAQILVPRSQEVQARNVLKEYYDGAFEASDEETTGDDAMESPPEDSNLPDDPSI
jgi:hypothetical protein